jgi:hypothetical protein
MAEILAQEGNGMAPERQADMAVALDGSSPRSPPAINTRSSPFQRASAQEP